MSQSSREQTEKKKKDQWVEAGSEFQIESYPCGSRRGQRTGKKSKNLALPSHTARRNNNSSAPRRSGRRQSTLTAAMTMNNSTMGMGGGNMTIGTATQDMHVNSTAGMPDLADLTIPDERKTYYEINKIKAMPLPIYQKKELKSQVMAIPILRLSGWGLLKWKSQRGFRYLKNWIMRTKRNCIFWKNSLDEINSQCGQNILTVFKFLKWTLLLNVFICKIVFSIIVFPFYDSYNFTVHTDEPLNNSNPLVCNGTSSSRNDTTVNVNSLVACCTDRYIDENSFETNFEASYNRSHSMNVFDSEVFLNNMVHEGINAIRSSSLFYGFYSGTNITVQFLGFEYTYSYPMSYLIVLLWMLVFCFLVLMRSFIAGVKEIILEREGEVNRYSQLIFGGWDHYTSGRGAIYKRKMLRKEMKTALKYEKLEDEKLEYSRSEQFRVYGVRILVNSIVFGLFCGFACFIYETTDCTLDLKDKIEKFAQGNLKFEALAWTVGFIPFVAIIYSNMLIRIVFEKIGKMEEYSLEVETGWTLIRSTLFFLVTIASAVCRFSQNVYCESDSSSCNACKQTTYMISETETEGQSNYNSNTTHIISTTNTTRIDCWENYFAEQIYRMLLTDLVIKIITTFLFDTTRVFLASCCPCKPFNYIGNFEFNILRHYLDILYILILTWLSVYFTPVFPLIAIIYLLITFYIKKFSLLYNSRGIPTNYRTIRIKSVLTLTKMISFSIVTSAIIVIIGYLNPSRGCGPFRYYTIAWEALTNKLDESHEYNYIHVIFNKIATPALFFPCILVLIFISYYYYKVAQTNRGTVETLRHLLILEGHDKTFLFSRINQQKTNSLSERSTVEATLNLEGR